MGRYASAQTICATERRNNSASHRVASSGLAHEPPNQHAILKPCTNKLNTACLADVVLAVAFPAVALAIAADVFRGLSLSAKSASSSDGHEVGLCVYTFNAAYNKFAVNVPATLVEIALANDGKIQPCV